MLQESLSKKLLTSVLSVYFLITFIVTCGQVAAEYYNTKESINNELSTLQQTFSGSLTRAIWELNTEQTVTIAEGLIAIPMIEGVIIRDDSGKIISQLGYSLDIRNIYSQQLIHDAATIEDTSSGLFGYTFPLIFEFSGRTTQVGDVTLFSSREVVFSRIMLSVYLLIGNAVIKTAFLIFLFTWAFRKQLTTPLTQLTQQIENLEVENLDDTVITINTPEKNELNVMVDSFNRLISTVVDYKNRLTDAQQALMQSNEKLDQQNVQLEQDVAKKTATLSQAMMDLQQRKYELEKQKLNLTEEIERRRDTEKSLLTKQNELENYVNDLNTAQERLVSSEKMAALGGLVAGITHDVNTPIGIGVTATSFLDERLQKIEAAYQNKTLSPKELEEFINDARQSTQLLASNLSRASELVASFKQVAVDQASDAVRTINLKQYLEEVVRSLQPKYKNTQHKINIQCQDNIILNLPAGAISQIVTNLIMNSLIHGFSDKKHGKIDLIITEQADDIEFIYQDNGKGLTHEQLEKLFDPFFTTRRDQGGSGLGTHIILNLVKQTLHGDIHATSTLGEGLSYRISIPKTLPNKIDLL